MARRQLLTDEQWTRLLAPPSDEREIIRYWTLSREDFDIIFRKRSDHSQPALPCCFAICGIREGRWMRTRCRRYASFIHCAAAWCQPSGVHQVQPAGSNQARTACRTRGTAPLPELRPSELPSLPWRDSPQFPRTSEDPICWLRWCWKSCAESDPYPDTEDAGTARAPGVKPG